MIEWNSFYNNIGKVSQGTHVYDHLWLIANFNKMLHLLIFLYSWDISLKKARHFLTFKIKQEVCKKSALSKICKKESKDSEELIN